MVDRPQHTVDYEAEVWARTLLIGSRRPTAYDKVRAYRILARTDPRSYRARLARALASWSYEQDGPQARLGLLEEAVAIARTLPGDDARDAEVVEDVLDSYQLVLYELGRRAEGLAVREEMAAVARRAAAAGNRGAVLHGLRSWAYGLAEEGRHGEAAAVLTELVELNASREGWGIDLWSRLALIAQLDAAGRTGEAVAALRVVLDEDRVRLLTDGTSLGGVFLTLVWYAQLLDRAGQPGEAGAARDEALALVRRLGATGEPKEWSGSQFTEAGILIPAQAQDVEPVVAGVPRPPFGTDPGGWSRDLRSRYLAEAGVSGCHVSDETGLLWEAVRHETRLPELVVLWRRLAIRTATYRLWRHGDRFLKPTLRVYDAGVAAARQLPDGHRPALVQALTDRALVLVAGHRYAAALTDYSEALQLRHGS